MNFFYILTLISMVSAAAASPPSPTEQPIPAPTAIPVPEPTSQPIPAPTAIPVPEPTSQPIPVPTRLPTPLPSTAGSYYPLFKISLLIDCMEPNPGSAGENDDVPNPAGIGKERNPVPSNETYEFSMKLRTPTGREYVQTIPTIFEGLGYASSSGEHVSWRNVIRDGASKPSTDILMTGLTREGGNVRSCADAPSGTSEEDKNFYAREDPGIEGVSDLRDAPGGFAVVWDQFMGLGKDMGFQYRPKFDDADPAFDGTESEFFTEGLDVSEICVTQTTENHGGNVDGVSLDILIQKFDVRGSTLYQSYPNEDTLKRKIPASENDDISVDVQIPSLTFAEFLQSKDGAIDVGENITRCVSMQEVTYDFKFQPRKVDNTLYFEQNALTYTMDLDPTFEAATYALAFDPDDEALPGARRGITRKFGNLDYHSYTISERPYPERVAENNSVYDEGRINYAYNSTHPGVKELCDAECIENGGAYKSWHPHVVVDWNITAGRWGYGARRSTLHRAYWRNGLNLTDDRRYFAVSYDRTLPTVTYDLDSTYFQYANDTTYLLERGVGCRTILDDETADDDDEFRNFDPDDRNRLNRGNPAKEGDGLPGSVNNKEKCIPTSLSDRMTMNVTVNEPGSYYFFAHVSFAQDKVESLITANTIEWVKNITDGDLYEQYVWCAAESRNCTNPVTFPHTERIMIPMDAEAFMFGFDFSFSEFAIYNFAMDDGMADDFQYGFNYAEGIRDFTLKFGNLSYDLVDFDADRTILNNFGTLRGGDTVQADATESDVQSVYATNFYNASDWQASRRLVTSTKDSKLSRVVTLQVEDGGFVSNFGRRCKVTMTLPRLANEFRYTSHRSQYYQKFGFRQNYFGFWEGDFQLLNDNGGGTTRAFAQERIDNPLDFLPDDDTVLSEPGAILPFGPRTQDFYNFTRLEKFLETVFVPDSSDKSIAIARSDAAGATTTPIILNKNLTSQYSNDYFFMIGQKDINTEFRRRKRSSVKAQLRLLYSNDPLFTFVPENAMVEIDVDKITFPSTLRNSYTGPLDDSSYVVPTALPRLNVTFANGVDYTTSDGGKATVIVSLTEPPSGIVKVAVSISDTTQAELFQGKSPLLIFTPETYQNLEITLIGKDDNTMKTGDAAFYITLSLVQTEDPRFVNRFDMANSIVSLTNLAVTGGDQRLAVQLNSTACVTTEAGGTCEVTVIVCTHQSGNMACGGDFLTKPIFMGGASRVVVDLSLDDRTEARFMSVRSNGRFDASSSSIDCEYGDLKERSTSDSICAAKVIFEPFSEDSGGNDMMGPYYATLVVAGMADWLADGTQPVTISIDSAKVVSVGESPKVEDLSAEAGTVYKESVILMNADADMPPGASVIGAFPNDYTAVVDQEAERSETTDNLVSTYVGHKTTSRFLQVTPYSCATTEDPESPQKYCTVTVTADLKKLARTVTSANDEVSCVRSTLMLEWAYAGPLVNCTESDHAACIDGFLTTLEAGDDDAVSDAVTDLAAAFDSSADDFIGVPRLELYGDADDINEAPVTNIDYYGNDNALEFTSTGTNIGDVESIVQHANKKIKATWLAKALANRPGAVPLYAETKDVCIVPGSIKGKAFNLNQRYVPNVRSGWIASVLIAGTDNYVWSSAQGSDVYSAIEEKKYLTDDNDGNDFSFTMPSEGVPINAFSGQAMDSFKVYAKVYSSDDGSLKVSQANATRFDNDFARLDSSGGSVTFSGTVDHIFSGSGSDATFSFNVTSINDDVDDDDEIYQIEAWVSDITYAAAPTSPNSVFSTGLAAPSTSVDGNGINNTSQLATVAVTHFDDDTAGVLIEAADSPAFRAYRTERVAPSDTIGGGHRYFKLTQNMTREWDSTMADSMVSFNVSLTSEPRSAVDVKITSTITKNAWGWQVEGLPLSDALGATSTYILDRYNSSSFWIHGMNDTVVNADTGYLMLAFNKTNWDQPQTVTIMGLDDFLDDGDQDYAMKIQTTSLDQYYSPTNSSNPYAFTNAGYMPPVIVPLRNQDDETASLVVTQDGMECSEPFRGIDAGLKLYLTSKPYSVVSLYLASSDPAEAGPTQQIVAITPDNWETMQTIPVSSVDDFVADGDVNFTVTVDLFYSLDSQYGNPALYDMSFDFMSLDDPDDEIGVTASVDLMVVTDASSTAADSDSVSYTDAMFTTAEGGVAALDVSLSYKPQAPVYVSVTTSKITQALLSTASTLVFTEENYMNKQRIVVVGKDDGTRNGDTTYDVVLGLESTEDPYYARFGFLPNDSTVRQTLTSRDYDYARVRVDLHIEQGGSLATATQLSNADYLASSSAEDRYDNWQFIGKNVVKLESDDGQKRTPQVYLSELDTSDRDTRGATGPEDPTNFVKVTVGLCQAIFLEGETDGVQTVALNASSLCGGYDLVGAEFFDQTGGDADADGVQLVDVEVALSDASEAMLQCINVTLAGGSSTPGCSVNRDGTLARLRFDYDKVPDLTPSNLEAQLYVIGLDDYVIDGDVRFNLSVSANVRYNRWKDTYPISAEYLPDSLIFATVDNDDDDDTSLPWARVSPGRACDVYEDGTGNCDMTIEIDGQAIGMSNDKLSDALYYVTVYAQYAMGAPTMNAQVQIASAGSLPEGANSASCGSTLFATHPKFSRLQNYTMGCPAVIYAWKNSSLTLDQITFNPSFMTTDDSYDDGDFDYTIMVNVTVAEGCDGNFDLYNASCDVLRNMQFEIAGTDYDDDTAGLKFMQADQVIYGYRSLRGMENGLDGLDDNLVSSRTIQLNDNVTSELASEVNNVTFSVALSSKPEKNVTVTIKSQSLSDKWGIDRFEGVPSIDSKSKSSESTPMGSGYKVRSYRSNADWIDSSTRSKDEVLNPDAGGVVLTFGPDNWNSNVDVTIFGLDDLAEDGDVEYNILVTVEGSDGDLYRYDTTASEFLFPSTKPFRIPLKNTDDEQAGWMVSQDGATVAEPYYGNVSTIIMYPKTEPSDVLMLSVSSSKPWIANTSETLLAITPSDWDQKRVVTVMAVDNFDDDGDIPFDIQLLLLSTGGETAYGALIKNATFSYTKMDDPADEDFSDFGSTSSASMLFGFGQNLNGDNQHFTTEYGGTGMELTDVTKTATVCLRAKLQVPPQDSVTYAVTVSDSTEAQILYPSSVVFTPENWDTYQEVIIIGRSDNEADGDVAYDVQFNVLGTNDPYYAALPLSYTSKTLINSDTVDQRMALGVGTVGCFRNGSNAMGDSVILTEGGGGSSFFGSDDGAASGCVLRAEICLSDTDTCTQPLSQQEVYNTTEGLAVTDIWVEAVIGNTSVARFDTGYFSYNYDDDGFGYKYCDMHTSDDNACCALETYDEQEACLMSSDVEWWQFGEGILVKKDGSRAVAHMTADADISTAFNVTIIAVDDTLSDSRISTEVTFFGELLRGSTVLTEFVGYYNDVAGRGLGKDVTVSGGTFETYRSGTAVTKTGVRTGSIGVVAKDDENPTIRFERVTKGCNTKESASLQTSFAADGVTVTNAGVGDGVCLVYLRLGAKPLSSDDEPNPSVTVKIKSFNNAEGKFMVLPVTDETDGVDVYSSTQLTRCGNAASPDGVSAGECPSSLVDTWEVELTAEDNNWSEAWKVVLVGQDDDVTDGDIEYKLQASVVASDDARYEGQVVNITFTNEDDDTDKIFVYQPSSSGVDYVLNSSHVVGARTAQSVDESSALGYACKRAMLILDKDRFGEHVDNRSPSDPPALGTATVTISDTTEALVSTSCDDASAWGQTVTFDGSQGCKTDPGDTEGTTLKLRASACTFYYRGVDDGEADGDIEFAVTVALTLHTDYQDTVTGDIYVNGTDSYTFYVTNYDDDSMHIDTSEINLVSNDGSTGNYTLTVAESPDGLSSTVESIVAGDRTGKLTFSYPNADTWDSEHTAFTKARVTFYFTENSGYYRLNFDPASTLDDALPFTTCEEANMNVKLFKSCYAEFQNPYQQFTVYFTAIADDVDNGGYNHLLQVNTTMFYNTFDDTDGSLTGSVAYKNARPQQVRLIIVEDDLAGLRIAQTDAETGVSLYSNVSYRSGSRSANQPAAPSASQDGFVRLPDRTTKEAGGNVSFTVALTSEPRQMTYVYIWSEAVARSDGSEERYEGIPWPSTYSWTKNHPSGLWHSQTEDLVTVDTDMYTVSKKLTFDTSNWDSPQTVKIVGLNDLYDDSSTDYSVWLTTVSADADDDPYYGTKLAALEVPLENEDDDVAGLYAYWDDYMSGPAVGTVSEPYLGYSATLYFYLGSKPTDSVLVTLTSSKPTQALPSESVVAISASDWESAESVLVYGVDDPILDGLQNFTISVQVVYSDDSDYGTAAENADGVAGRMALTLPGRCLDDPTDSPATTCQKGEYGLFGVGSQYSSQNCSACAAGTFAEHAGDKVSCRSCPPGTFGAWTGAQALGNAVDYDGSALEPGCLPCPNNTYSDEWGATACKTCPEGKHCWPLATTTPKRIKPWERWSASFDRRWSQVTSEAYDATVNYFGSTVSMNRDQYEAYLIVSAFFAWFIFALALGLFYLLGPRNTRDKMIRFFRMFDAYARSHSTESKNEEFAESSHAPSALGGVITIGLLVLAFITAVIMFFMYINYNTLATSQLDVYNSTFVADTAVDMEIIVGFVGFSGCVNSTWLATSVGEATVPSMIATGVSYGGISTDYRCADGDLLMNVQVSDMKAVTNPKFSFGVEAVCSACSDSGALPAFSGNTVLNCPDCTLASAQAIRYSVKATNNFPYAPGLHDADDNFINGSETPSTATSAFRGEEATEVKVLLMPSQYENLQTAKRKDAYRLVYSESTLGSTVQFHGATDFYGGDSSTTSSSAKPGNYFTWVKEDSFVDAATVNAVKFVLNMPLATSRVNIKIQNAETFLELWAKIGGTIGLIVAVFLLGMNYVERANDRNDPVGSCWEYYYRQFLKIRGDVHSQWHPEPDSWTMANIARMQKREEKRDGGARKVEDAAVTNFKDLYTRNKVNDKDAHDVEEDYDHEVDDYHGEI